MPGRRPVTAPPSPPFSVPAGRAARLVAFDGLRGGERKRQARQIFRRQFPMDNAVGQGIGNGDRVIRECTRHRRYHKS